MGNSDGRSHKSRIGSQNIQVVSDNTSLAINSKELHIVSLGVRALQFQTVGGGGVQPTGPDPLDPPTMVRLYSAFEIHLVHHLLTFLFFIFVSAKTRNIVHFDLKI